jgi:uncharacterized protein YceH (UPF0502 family)
MAHFDLTPAETRVLGCLLEKERLTPENYPLSLNSLVAACNQSTNREPVLSLDDGTVEEAVSALRAKRLAMIVHQAGARVEKYRHTLPEHYDLAAKEVAVLSVLMLRGPQTPGELRGRTERMHPFASLEDVEACLNELAKGDEPLVRVCPARPGQKERRFVELLSGEPSAELLEGPSRITASRTGDPGLQSRVEQLERALTEARAELSQLSDEFARFRKQFE